MSALENAEVAVADQNGAAARDGRIAVENPATGQVIGHVDDMDPARVATIVERARAAQPGWEALGFEQRAAKMRALRWWLVTNRRRVIDILVAEGGKTPEDAMLGDLWYVCDALGFWGKKASKYLADERVKTHSPLLLGKKVIVRYRPVGLVGVIGPWNYPLTNTFGDVIPALMAGNSVVMKPSEVTPLTSLLVAEGAAAVGMPDGVLSVATGAGETGAALIDNVDMIHFTGSTRTGRKVATRAGERLIPASLELGGKDPMIVLDDADLERAANMAVQWAMANSGQICMAVERVYVEEGIYDRFVSSVVEKVSGLRQGAPGEPGSVDIGAMTFPPQIDIVDRHVRDAVDKGANVLVGGRKAEGPGRFYEPTVLTGVDHTMDVMRDETFGPVLPIMKVRDAEEAVRLANDTHYGLNSSVFTKDLEKGERIARRLGAGNACVNDALMNYMATEAPFGGTNESGLGVRHGPQGIRKYCSSQTIMVTRFGPKREFGQFPNKRITSKIFERLMVLLWGRRPRR
ncbi:MAG: succinate-semialdehyde dehydrogenase [Candidatus Rokuibacteriota bacterium]|nr:MAG: succinate-semialdehyde dehydrogenase [Candidatus Rokubacteria bacterium]